MDIILVGYVEEFGCYKILTPTDSCEDTKCLTCIRKDIPCEVWLMHDGKVLTVLLNREKKVAVINAHLVTVSGAGLEAL